MCPKKQEEAFWKNEFFSNKCRMFTKMIYWVPEKNLTNLTICEHFVEFWILSFGMKMVISTGLKKRRERQKTAFRLRLKNLFQSLKDPLFNQF